MNTKKTHNKILNAVVGIDLGDKIHTICVTDKHGNIRLEFTCPNERAFIERLAQDYPDALVAMEVGTHSPWISRLFAGQGVKVLVANARKLRAIYQNERKCDRYDAQMLAKIARLDPDLLYPIHHKSEEAQRDLIDVKLRDTLVRQRGNIIRSIRGILKSMGYGMPSCSTPCMANHARAFLQSQEQSQLLERIEPSLKTLDELNLQIREYDNRIKKAAEEKYPEALHLQQIPGVGPITSLSYVLIIEDPERFKDPRDVGAYLGMVPKRDQSGTSDKQLPISKTGNGDLRRLLVQSAQYILGHFGPESELRDYGLKLAARGGKGAKAKAVVAVARKLAVLMLALWKSQSNYDPSHHKTKTSAKISA